jgi:transcriptional regulator with GAF, ATPase, and Fis domain
MGVDERRLEGTRAAEFVLAAAGPVSLDALVGWGLARPTELWGWLDEGRDRSWIGEDRVAGPGHFVLLDPERQRRALGDAGPGDWAWLVAAPGILPSVIVNARRASDERRQDVASAIFRGLLVMARPETFPGGSPAWAALVVECVRRFRFLAWLDEGVLDRAIEAAVAHGSLEWQAILCGARGFASMRASRLDDGSESLERALEAARALDSRAVSFEVHLQVAFAQILAGQAQAAIATFERLLGDVPREILPLPSDLQPPLDPVPETGLAILASTYAQVGQYGRALDLLHRLRVAGERAGRPSLVGLADCYLSGLHAGRREFDPARLYAESAFAYWTADRTGPYFLWHASISLAWVRMTEGRLAGAVDILEAGQRARLASGLMFFGGSALFEVLDRMDVEGVAPPPGLDVETELERMLAWPDGYMRAVAHRFRARRLARNPLDDAGQALVSGHHERSVALLRESRACASELARALNDAAQWAERQGRRADADRLHAEAQRLFVSIDLAPASASVLDLATALLELGRLGAGIDAPDASWGDLAARLCALLAVERCAILEWGPGTPALLASRGGGPAWVEEIRALLAERRPEAVEALAPMPTDHESTAGGQLLIVPFGSARRPLSGWAVFENRYSRALVSASDARVLDVLGAQLGVLAENFAIWRELLEARRRLEQENRYYRQAPNLPSSGGRLVGESPALRQTLDLVARVAPTAATVLIEGETGVGKELVAREIHRLSPRRGGPFIAVHIASFAPGLVASSLFGHERGAFTGATEQTRGRFELADGGTLFLDEVGELTLEDQVRLLRVLQEGTFERVGGTRPLHSDFRLVAATNRDLRASVARGQFREDLFFRLSAFPVLVPPLRERREEIPTLALYFMDRANRTLARQFEGIGEADMARLVVYRWPGNVRELEHLIERAAILSELPRLKIPPLQDAPDAAEPRSDDRIGTLEDAEREYFRQLIARTAGRVSGPSGAAAIAGLKPSTFSWHVEKLGLRADLQRARAEAGRPPSA